MDKKFLEPEVRAFVANALAKMSECIAYGFSRLDEEEYFQNLEVLKTRVAIAITEKAKHSDLTNDLLMRFEAALADWCSVSGKGREKQNQRRIILNDIRSWYVGWCLKNSASEEVEEAQQSQRIGNHGEPSNQQEDRRSRFGRIMRSCAVKDRPGTFILGCFDRRKTVHTQQRRANALVNALSEYGAISAGSRVGVVGGGFGGLSAATAAYYYGAEVVVYERQSDLIPIQHGSSQRFLHPNIYDWPKDIAFDGSSKLPFLNWCAGTAEETARQVRAEFLGICENAVEGHAGKGSIKYECNREIVDAPLLPQHTGSEKCSLVSGDNEVNEKFDVVIIAIGFGLETSQNLAIPRVLYWDENSLGQPTGFSTDYPERVLISGTGDGALVDCIRATIRGFEHTEILDQFELLRDRDLHTKLLASEVEAENFRHANPYIPFDYYKAYKKILEDYNTKGIFEDKAFRERVVHLNHRESEVFSKNSSILNRIFVQVLQKEGLVKFRRGRITPESLRMNENGMVEVPFRTTEPPETYHRVVLRHGVKHDFFADCFPEVWRDAAKDHKVMTELEVTSYLPDELVFNEG